MAMAPTWSSNGVGDRLLRGDEFGLADVSDGSWADDRYRPTAAPKLSSELMMRRSAIHDAGGPLPPPACCKALCGRGLWRDLEAPRSAGFRARARSALRGPTRRNCSRFYVFRQGSAAGIRLGSNG
jgi:hypothetical protein